MKTIELAAILVAMLLIFIVFFSLVKGEKKRINIINADGSQVSVDAEIADNPITQAKGLMGRKSLGETEGMMFVFDKPGRYSLWMLNTTIPLDAVFISEDKTVVDIIAMEPCGFNVTRCKTYTPGADAKYILEVNQGFSKRYGISVGKSRFEFQ
jgi:uncharacterized protein